MSIGTFSITLAFVYIGVLFLIAHWGDRRSDRAGADAWRDRTWVYPLSLAVYCTSWTFFGSVGLSSRQGYDFLAIYLGPILLYTLFWPLIVRVIRLAKAQNITSIADFIGARYGKSQEVAAAVAILLTLGMLPYIALQLKAVSSSLTVMLQPSEVANIAQQLPFFGDIALIVAVGMAGFAILFGTRHADATEHQEGLMLAVAMESLVKLVTFLTVGLFVVYVMFDGFGDVFRRAADAGRAAPFLQAPALGQFITMCLLSFLAALLLPRMFHVAVVENHSVAEVRRASWLFPIYLVLINMFVVPIALAGLASFPPGSVDSDMFVILLPLKQESPFIAMLAFVGGLSSATAMVIVVCVALAIMISNDLILPALVRRTSSRTPRSGLPQPDMSRFILSVRRTVIFAVLMSAYLYYRIAGDADLAAIGLLAFAAVAQLAPAFLGGLIWRRGTALGAIAGICIGGMLWAYTLLLPTFAVSGLYDPALLSAGPWGISWLRPQYLFGGDLGPLPNGVFWSLLANAIAYIAFSQLRAPKPIEILQANLFVGNDGGAVAVQSSPYWHSSVTVEDLQSTVARYLGEERTLTSFENFARERAKPLSMKAEADLHLVRYAEHLLASAIGAASSRLVLSLLLRNQTVSTKQALKLLDDANAAMQYNRDVLQTALTHARQGISVIDRDHRLVFWNQPFAEILGLPADVLSIGRPLGEILHLLAERGEFGPGEPWDLVRTRIGAMIQTLEPYQERLHQRGIVLEIRSADMPGSSIVTTYTDVTTSVLAAEELERANETLERRVHERTEELTRLNEELARAKADADDANLSKTRFLAAASHDILQPLNAARLYATSLVERSVPGPDGALARNVDASLEAVEEILGALLDISRLDAGAMKPDIAAFHLDELFRQLAVEFAPLANARGLKLAFVNTGVTVRSDRRLLRRVLQNFIANAIKYTPKGKVLVGVRRRGHHIRLEVHDTGLGIPQNKQKAIFKEFQRLEQGAKIARGLGLGLSIVERIARVLGHKLEVRSRSGKGSCFALVLPEGVAIPAAQAAPADAARSPAALDSMVIIAIDNEEQILDGMNTLLQGWGCKVFKGINARAALADFGDSRLLPDAIVVDYHLDDDSNGIDAASHLRWRFGRQIPAVLLTADRSPEVRDEATAKDMVVLNKPLRPAALRALLAQWRRQQAVSQT